MKKTPSPSSSKRQEALRVETVAAEEQVYQHAYSAVVWWAAFSFAAILGFSRLSYGLLLPSIRADLSGSYGAFGLVGTANFAGYLIGTLATPAILTRYTNRIRLNIYALIGMNVTLMASAFSFDLWQLGFWRLLIGIFSALATVLTMGLTLERVYPAERGRATGLAWMGASFGIVISGLISPPIILTGSNLAWRLVWIAMGGLGVVAAFGLYRALLAHTPPVSASAASGQPKVEVKLSTIMSELFQPRGLLFLTCCYFAFGFGYIIYSVFFISLVKEQGLPEVLTGLIWAVTGATGIAGSFVWGRAFDRWPNGFVLAVSAGVGALGGAVILVGLLPIEFIGAGLMGMSLIGVPIIVTVLLKMVVPAERYTSSFSFITSIFAIGQMTGPLVGGVVVDSFGLPAGIAVSAISLTVAMVCALLYGTVHRKENKIQQHR